MAPPTYRVLLKATAGEDANDHTVLLDLGAQEIRRIAAFGRLVRQHRLSTVTAFWGFSIWEGCSLPGTCTTDQAEIEDHLSTNGAEGRLHTDTEEIVVGFGGDSFWVSFRVKNIDGREWSTDSVRIADLESALAQPRGIPSGCPT